jgi:large subunit ribosomal protein L1
VFHLDEGIRLARSSSTAAFNESIDVCIQLAVDPRKPNQNIRGIAQLPHGTGKAVAIAVFARGEKAEEAKKAGATFVGAEDLIEKISEGRGIDFNKAIATPDLMPLVGKIARVSNLSSPLLSFPLLALFLTRTLCRFLVLEV